MLATISFDKKMDIVCIERNSDGWRIKSSYRGFFQERRKSRSREASIFILELRLI